MVGNILNQLGGGSGLDTMALVKDLVALERAPQQQRLDARQEKLEAQISGLGMLRSAMGELESSLAALGAADTFNAKQVAIPDTSLIAISQLQADAVPGNYRLKVEQVAQSQSMSSGVYASVDSAVGEGSLTLQFGDWDAGQTAFTVDPNATGATIEIDASNNSLTGLRAAINDSGIGVQASIVGTEGNYQLLLTSPTGATKELQITAAETVGQEGLANFNFNETTQSLTQQQEGLDAVMKVNGFQVTRSTNTITDVIEGVEFDIFNSSATEEVSINISADQSLAETAIRDFVEAYNTFQQEARRLTGNEVDEEGAGSLRNDSLAGNLIRSIRSQIGSAVPGIDDGFNSLANLGIRTRQADGTLQIIENDPNEPNTDFPAALRDNFESIRDMFTPKADSSSAQVKINGYGIRTQPGNYEVEISQDATKGFLNAAPLPVATTFPLDTTGKDYSFTILVDGKAAEVALPGSKTYSSGDELAAEIQALINLDEDLKNSNVRANVSFNTATNSLEFQSDAYGANSKIEFSAVGADAAELGLAVGAGTAGVDVAGTIDGEAAFGFGDVLLPAIGSPAEGLKMIIAPGATSANVNFSRGFAGGLIELMDTYLENSGLINERESNIKDNLVDVADDRSALDRRTEAFRARLEAQFIVMESIVRSLNNTGTFLDGLSDRLPFTAPQG